VLYMIVLSSARYEIGWFETGLSRAPGDVLQQLAMLKMPPEILTETRSPAPLQRSRARRAEPYRPP